MTNLPRTYPLAVSCSCPQCRDRRIPLHVCAAWLDATVELRLPLDLPMQTFRFRCGRTRIITWGDIDAVRHRLEWPKAS